MINPLELTGRNILVTGASSGIGKATAIVLSQLGARLILVARNVHRLEETAQQLEGTGHRTEVFDLEQVEDIPKWMKNVAAEVGTLSAVVHCAGVHFVRPLRILGAAEFSDMMTSNVTSAMALAKGYRQKNVCHAEGRLVFISSVMGLVGQPGVAAYSASKGALIALTKSLSLELARERITVNCIVPGQVSTEMTVRQKAALGAEQFAAIEAMHPLGIGSPVDIAYAVAYLVADTGRWITGTSLIVDGGYTAH